MELYDILSHLYTYLNLKKTTYRCFNFTVYHQEMFFGHCTLILHHHHITFILHVYRTS